MAWARLTFTERTEIARMHDGRKGVRGIARALGRAPSMISRELARNVSPSPRRYRAFPARLMARERTWRPKPRKLAAGTPARAAVVLRLARINHVGWFC